MQEIKVEFVEESASFAGHGLVTGVIFFDLGTFQFPEREWNDAAVVIVGWWLAALGDFVTGSSSEIELRFMEGPYSLSIRRGAGDECQIQCIEKIIVQEKFQCRGSALDLLRSTLKVATRVQRVCSRNGWQSVDIEALDGLVNAARKVVGVVRLGVDQGRNACDST
jgi:hypothetical protein